ncbi:glycosyltransferase family 2 protein [Thermoproteota archaeon]
MTSDKMSLSIVMPCYNEGDVIEEVVRSYYKTIISKIDDSEFIIVNDCSTDSTPQVLEALNRELPSLKIIKTPVNSGYGIAIRTGYEAAQKQWVFQVDSDNQFEAGDFWKLYELKDKHNFVLGIRQKRHDAFFRLILTKILRLTNFLIMGVWIRDVNCPYRLIKREALDRFLASIDRKSLIPNILISILAKRNIDIAQVPITHHERKTGIVSIRKWGLIKFALRGFLQIITFRLRYRVLA